MGGKDKVKELSASHERRKRYGGLARSRKQVHRPGGRSVASSTPARRTKKRNKIRGKRERVRRGKGGRKGEKPRIQDYLKERALRLKRKRKKKIPASSLEEKGKKKGRRPSRPLGPCKREKLFDWRLRNSAGCDKKKVWVEVVEPSKGGELARRKRENSMATGKRGKFQQR